MRLIAASVIGLSILVTTSLFTSVTSETSPDLFFRWVGVYNSMRSNANTDWCNTQNQLGPETEPETDLDKIYCFPKTQNT